MANYTNSSLATVSVPSPFKSPREYDGQPFLIAIHCMAGDLTAKGCGDWMAQKNTNASSHYGIDSQGTIGQYVDEKYRAWATGGKKTLNGYTGRLIDHRAITIEVANCGGADQGWPVSAQAYESLVKLCADICRRNGIKELKWQGDPNLVGQWDKQNLMVHRWFAYKDCPGNYLYNHMGDIAQRVNVLLSTAANQ